MSDFARRPLREDFDRVRSTGRANAQVRIYQVLFKVSFYALNLPSYQNVIGIYGDLTPYHGYPRIYDDRQFEVKFYVSENQGDYYRCPKLGYVFDEYGVVQFEMSDEIVTGLVEFDMREEKWILNEVLTYEPAIVGVVCLIEDQNSTFLYAKMLDEPPNRTIQLENSIFSNKPELGKFYAVLYDESDGPYAAVETGPRFNVKVRGNLPFLMAKTWVRMIGYTAGCIHGYSEDLEIDVYDNSKRFK